MEAKGNIRKEVFARRRAATQEEIREKSRIIYEKITALPEFLDADCFFADMDFKQEVMTRDLIEKALKMGKTVAVPRVEGDDMVYKGVTNIGRKPTIGRYDIGVETCLLDFDRDIYGKKIMVEFYERIRPEKKFPGLDELKNQMEADKAKVARWQM